MSKDWTININNESSYFDYIPNILSVQEYKILKEWLESKIFCPGICINDKKIPREQLWFHKNNKYFCSSWIYRYDRWESRNYDKLLIDIQKIIQKKVKQYFDKKINNGIDIPLINSCLINKYNNGEDSINAHRDCIDSFGLYPTIIGLSIGYERNIKIKKIKFNKNNIHSLKPNQDTSDNLDIKLEDNSLFIMAGASQKYFTHEIPKCNSSGTRYSLTFRHHKD